MSCGSGGELCACNAAKEDRGARRGRTNAVVLERLQYVPIEQRDRGEPLQESLIDGYKERQLVGKGAHLRGEHGMREGREGDAKEGSGFRRPDNQKQKKSNFFLFRRRKKKLAEVAGKKGN